VAAENFKFSAPGATPPEPRRPAILRASQDYCGACPFVKALLLCQLPHYALLTREQMYRFPKKKRVNRLSVWEARKLF
jgi:hypothetical protein